MTRAALCALCLLALAAPALADQPPRTGRWPCFFGAEPFGVLTLTEGSYALSGAAEYSGSGGLRWGDGVFEFAGGTLPQKGVTGGLVYLPPDGSGGWAVDLYSDMGTVLTCKAAG